MNSLPHAEQILTEAKRTYTHKPAPYENVVAVGPNFRCLGYVDRRGIWRKTTDRQILRSVLEWHSL